MPLDAIVVLIHNKKKKKKEEWFGWAEISFEKNVDVVPSIPLTTQPRADQGYLVLWSKGPIFSEKWLSSALIDEVS